MDLDFEAWLLVGHEKKWISNVFCDTHEGAPMTDEEADEWEAGFDPCSFHVKLLDLN